MSVTLRETDRTVLKTVLEADYETVDKAYKALLEAAATLFSTRELWCVKPNSVNCLYGPLYTKQQVRQACAALAQPVKIMQLQPLQGLLAHVSKHEALVDPGGVCGCGHPLVLHWTGCTVHLCGCEVNDAT